MKMLVLAALAALLATPALAADKTAASPAKGNDALQAVLNQFDANWAKGDAKAMSPLYTDDATLLTAEGKMVKGRADIESALATMISANPGSKAHHTISNVRWLGKDWALADVDTSYGDASQASTGAGDATLPKIHVVLLFHQQGGKWQVADSRPYMLAPESAATPAPTGK